MNKLKLDVESLNVQTFDTGSGSGSGAGTVRGHTGEFCIDDLPTIATCEGMGSCPKSACGPTCGNTMVNTCQSCTCWATGCPQC